MELLRNYFRLVIQRILMPSIVRLVLLELLLGASLTGGTEHQHRSQRLLLVVGLEHDAWR